MINFFSSSGSTIAGFVVSLVLARLLSPGEIGVYSMTIVFVNMVHIFRDFGIGTYLQQERELTPQKIRAATGVVFTSSWLIALGLFLASPWFGRWFAEPRMVPVMEVLAIGFLFIPFGTVTTSLLAREFEAGKQAIVNVIGTAVFAITCLGLAFLGFGTMSMAWANLANIIATGCALALMRPKNMPWMPSFRHWRNVLHFGVGTLLSNFMNSINNAIGDILLGKLGNATLVGFFSRASSTIGIFGYVAGSTMNYGSISYISQAHHRGEPLGPLLNRATSLVTAVAWPAFGLTYLLGREIIITLYGPQWLEAVPAINALAIAASIGIVFNYTSIALTAVGRPYLSAVPTVVTIITRITFGVVLFNGHIESFAWAICAATIAAAPVLIAQHYIVLHHRFTTMLVALWPSAVVTSACMATAMLLKAVLPASLPAIAVLLIMAVPLATVWYVGLRLTRHPMVSELHLLGAGFWARVKRRMGQKRDVLPRGLN
ncbi:oligosaccharide flippase family protein [Noviherbaspirillum soli]|uniref:oligosaccharide flippase family protein n=1 Tax=Noviherbaspirillum soli TaxID=1064518 RepID=UPI002B26D0B1|nr:oligosaccharide flippase family protein [Noviherbaspirillum soli]